MRRILLNSVTLATATHKELRGVSDGTGAQVGVWMINNCKAQMIENAYIICKGSPREGTERKTERIL